MIGPIVDVRLRISDFSATVRGSPAPVRVTDVPTRTQIWREFAAAELVLLILGEAVALASTWRIT